MLKVSQLHGFNVPRVTASSLSNLKSISITDTSGAKTLLRTQGAGSSRRKMTFSYWFRTTSVTACECYMQNGGNDFLGYSASSGAPGPLLILGSGTDGYALTTGITFVNNTWYHVVMQLDTANATASNRCKIFIDGTDRTDLSGGAFTQNYDTSWGANGVTDGFFNDNGGPGASTTLIDETSRIDNQLLSPSSFATANRPIDISGLTFGAQGYWIRHETGVAATIGNDSSGNGLNFTNSGYVVGDFSSTVP